MSITNSIKSITYFSKTFLTDKSYIATFNNCTITGKLVVMGAKEQPATPKRKGTYTSSSLIQAANQYLITLTFSLGNKNSKKSNFKLCRRQERCPFGKIMSLFSHIRGGTGPNP